MIALAVIVSVIAVMVIVVLLLRAGGLKGVLAIERANVEVAHAALNALIAAGE